MIRAIVEAIDEKELTTVEPSEEDSWAANVDYTEPWTDQAVTRFDFAWVVGDDIAAVNGFEMGDDFYIWSMQLDRKLRGSLLFVRIMKYLNDRFGKVYGLAVEPGLESFWNRVVQRGLMVDWWPAAETHRAFPGIAEIF